MKTIDYLKLQAKNLHKDFRTKKPYFDAKFGDYFYDYEPKFFDVDALLISFNIDQDKFKLMNAQHIIARLVGFEKWGDLLRATPEAQELSKLLFDNMHKICIEEWEDYIVRAERDNDVEFDDETRLDIFQQVFANVEGHESFKMDYRLSKTKEATKENQVLKPKKRKSSVKISALPLAGADRIEFLEVANEKFEYVLHTIEPRYPELVRKMWDAEEYIDEILLTPDMLPIDREYALSLIDAFLVGHTIQLALEADNQAVHLN